MYIYLNTPRVFWQIPGTDIRLTRSNPIIEVTEAEMEELTAEQKGVLNFGIETRILTKVNKSFVPTAAGMTTIKILKLPVQEIQRRYVSQMILNKNLDGIQELLAAEEKSKKSRPAVLAVLENAKAMVLNVAPEEKFYREIEEAVENIEGVIVKESKPSRAKGKAKKPAPTRRVRRQAKAKTVGETEK